MMRFKPYTRYFYRLFDTYWLPVYLLLATSWLFAPALHHAHYSDLTVISGYEATGQPWGWLFRTCDALAAVTLLLGTWRYKVLRKDRLIGGALIAIAGLSLIDALFPMGCLGTCSLIEKFSWGLHDIESSILAVVVALSAVIVYWRSRSWLSLALIVTQLGMGLVALSGLVSHPSLVVIQFAYVLTVVAWAAWLLSSFAPRVLPTERGQVRVRRLYMWLTVVTGVTVLVAAAAQRHLFGHFLESAFVSAGPQWPTRHGVIAGLLLLYIARQIGKGQRRAAVLLAIVAATFVMVYALYRPHPLPLGLSLLLLVLLWHYGSAFDRNVGPPPLASRLKDFAVVLAGVLVAATIIVAATIATGRQQQLITSLHRAYQKNTSAISRRAKQLPERYEDRLQSVSSTLGASLVTLLAWTIFRPSGAKAPTQASERSRAERLLKTYSNSSEDYFKLWPQDKQYFFGDNMEGFVAYKLEGSVAFALADPITPPTQRQELVKQFVAFCRRNGWRACFLLIQDTSRTYYAPELALISIGSGAVINVEQFAQVTLREKWWRWQANRAQKAGYQYQALTPPHSEAIIAQLRTVSDQWLMRPNHREQGFALGYFDKHYLQQCIVHVLRDRQDKIVAFANELPVFGKSTQRTIDLMRFIPDTNGTMATLIMYILLDWRQKGTVTTFDLGLVPLAKVDTTLTSIARALAASRFSAGGLAQFKGKFRPEWQPSYVAYDGDVLDLAVILTALNAVLKAH